MPKCTELLPCDWLIRYLHEQAVEQVFLIKWLVSVYTQVIASNMGCSRFVSNTFPDHLSKATNHNDCSSKWRYTASASCSLLIALCSARSTDFMVYQGSPRLVRLDSLILAFSTPLAILQLWNDLFNMYRTRNRKTNILEKHHMLCILPHTLVRLKCKPSWSVFLTKIHICVLSLSLPLHLW